MADDPYYGDASAGKRVYCAWATTTAMVAYSTAAATGGPLLYNPSGSNVLGRILKVGFAVTTASTAAVALGFTGGASTAPSSTTAAETTGNLYMGGVLPSIDAFRVGTVSAAGTFFLPFGQITTGALTVSRDSTNWIDVNRLITIPPGTFCSVAASAVASTCVLQCAVIWEEVAI